MATPNLGEIEPEIRKQLSAHAAASGHTDLAHRMQHRDWFPDLYWQLGQTNPELERVLHDLNRVVETHSLISEENRTSNHVLVSYSTMAVYDKLRESGIVPEVTADTANLVRDRIQAAQDPPHKGPDYPTIVDFIVRAASGTPHPMPVLVKAGALMMYDMVTSERDKRKTIDDAVYRVSSTIQS